MMEIVCQKIRNGTFWNKNLEYFIYLYKYRCSTQTLHLILIFWRTQILDHGLRVAFLNLSFSYNFKNATLRPWLKISVRQKIKKRCLKIFQNSKTLSFSKMNLSQTWSSKLLISCILLYISVFFQRYFYLFKRRVRFIEWK